MYLLSHQLKLIFPLEEYFKETLSCSFSQLIRQREANERERDARWVHLGNYATKSWFSLRYLSCCAIQEMWWWCYYYCWSGGYSKTLCGTMKIVNIIWGVIKKGQFSLFLCFSFTLALARLSIDPEALYLRFNVVAPSVRYTLINNYHVITPVWQQFG